MTRGRDEDQPGHTTASTSGSVERGYCGWSRRARASNSYKAQDYVDERLCGLDFHQLVDIFGDSLYDRRTGRGRVLLYNVGGVREHGKFDMVVTGRTYADIGRFIDERVPALIARYMGGRRRGSDGPHATAGPADRASMARQSHVGGRLRLPGLDRASPRQK